MSFEDRIELYTASHMGLACDFQVNPDSCGNHEHYEEYIRFIAIGDKTAGMGTTHAFVRDDGTEQKLLGYITLRATSYIKMIDNIPHGSPAIEIFELAVNKDYEKNGIGTILVQFAITLAGELNEGSMGIRYITLCADKLAVPFYEKMGFAKVEDYGEIPRENWNVNCIPMFLKIPDLPN